MKGIETIKRENAAASTKKTKRARSRKGTAKPAKEATAQSKGAAEDTRTSFRDVADPGVNESVAPADTRPLGVRDFPASEYLFARPDEPPASLIPPEIQAELDRLKMVNRSLRAALRILLEDE